MEMCRRSRQRSASSGGERVPFLISEKRDAPHRRCVAAGPEIVSVDYHRDKSQQSTTIGLPAKSDIRPQTPCKSPMK